jgi:Saxitoxin biosynthesis operon protein SxtJ
MVGMGILMGSNRRFGLVVVGVCLVLYGWGAWSGSGRIGWLVTAAILLTVTLAVPRVLEPFKRLWLRLGHLLHIVVSPVVLAFFYYTAVTPIGLVMQLFGSDPLQLKRGRMTYWIERQPPGPEPRTMRQPY